MRQEQTELTIETPGVGFVDITRAVAGFVTESRIAEGLVTLFLRHTSASLVIQENADPDVLEDLTDFLARLAPWDGSYRHGTEGPDDMPAHIRAALTQSQLSIPVADGRLALGTWQGIYVAEHRARAYTRRVRLHIIGD